MSLSREDKKDVKGAMGKALANKVSKVTRDGGWGEVHKRANEIREEKAEAKMMSRLKTKYKGVAMTRKFLD